MASGDRSGRGGWFPRMRILEGEPWQIGRRELTPVLRAFSLGSGNWGLRWLRPLAVRESTAEGQREIDITGWGIPFSAVVIGFLAPVALWLLARRRA